MPVFPEPDYSHANPEQKGVYKSATPHKTIPEHLVLTYHEGKTASAETQFFKTAENFLQPEEKQAYAVSRFYFRRLLHILDSTLFPNCSFASDKALVVERRDGVPHSWEELPRETAVKIAEQLKGLGLPLNFIDMSGSENFHKANGEFFIYR